MKTQFVKIHWNDAASTDEWTHLDNIKPALHMIVTVGILIRETDSILVVALNHDITENNFSQFINIPKKWIIQRKVIKA